jgi:hypothetical protein
LTQADDIGRFGGIWENDAVRSADHLIQASPSVGTAPFDRGGIALVAHLDQDLLPTATASKPDIRSPPP